ncbi:CBS domain-containing protein [Actinoplanes campanulatus]|uniref:CBS domain-containing protein n=1 Tax=Actinoplanes campanulatus TaxID=113559 RepID=A0A7W5AK59_9ACTN|nr:IMP dehydrogenase [Actinoplanes campanulatus]MBB3097783.1 CBS domain-containing protein [Actinoplanes campanulatus]GGN38297.1 hypothetical protein GCM10010109_65060 [Actinoplanes campanulatus]GID39648.1 hypothetical protein Aca09nite_61540 [Actinoplanes campanulatus]
MRILSDTSRTFGEFLLLPNLTGETCTPERVDMSAPLVRHPVGQPSPIRVATPIVSAIMGAVSSPRLAIALAQVGGLSFLHQNQPIDDQATMVATVKRHKAGFRHNDVNIKPVATLHEADLLMKESRLDVVVVTDDGTPSGRFLGLLTSRDYNFHRHQPSGSVESRMLPVADLVTAPAGTSLEQANSLLWDSRQDVLPILDTTGQLTALVQRRDYELHEQFRNESVDADKRFRVGAGVNTATALHRNG